MTSLTLNLPDGVGDVDALRQVPINLKEPGDDLFWHLSLLWYEGPPGCVSHSIRGNHSEGGGALLYRDREGVRFHRTICLVRTYDLTWQVHASGSSPVLLSFLLR